MNPDDGLPADLNRVAPDEPGTGRGGDRGADRADGAVQGTVGSARDTSDRSRDTGDRARDPARWPDDLGPASGSDPERGVDWTALESPRVGDDLLPDHSFALCLTHDVDRPFRRLGSLADALRDRDPRHLRGLLPWHEPGWQFDAVTTLEAELGVRSAFYFLDEQRLLRDRPPSDWLQPSKWRLFADRYSLTDPRIAHQIRRLDDRGWEVGLHGSYESYADPGRLRREKAELEAVLGHEVLGGRQHYLNRRLPGTWRNHADLGLRYDATLGSSRTVGFQFGDGPVRPFGDEFVALPLTIMEVALPDPGEHLERAWRTCERVLEEAAERGAVATVLWHPRVFDERDWPGYATVYRRLIERALELDAWVGPPGELYAELDHEDVADGPWERRPDEEARRRPQLSAAGDE